MKRTAATVFITQGKTFFKEEYFVEDEPGSGFRAAFDIAGQTVSGNWRPTAAAAMADAKAVYKLARVIGQDLLDLERWNRGEAKRV